MEIPILGYLFGSEGFVEQNIEGAIFVVPSVLDSLPVDASRLVEEALRQFSEFDGDMSTVEPFQMLPTPGRPAPAFAPTLPPTPPAPPSSPPARR
jgi:pilus assembly protein CpaC